MTIEEKAKAYNKVREKIALRFGSNVAEEIFSEFEMSEDEKIIKEIISIIKSYRENCITEGNHRFNDCIAWLEKQKEPELSEDLGEYVAELSKQFPEVSFAKLSRIAVRVKNWLEKQDERKSTDKPKFEIGDEIKTDNEVPLIITKIDEQGYWSGDLFICSFEDSAKWELVGKIIDKVEPKFKVGDFIVNDYCAGKVIALTDDAYLLDTGQGIPFSYEYNARLWTIEDAKDGDVLATDKSVFIYAKTLYNKPYAYCGVDKYGVFKDNCLKNNWANSVNNIHPATKEQRDTLMKAMADAGYTFDFEKKELKKIEQKQVIDYPDNLPKDNWEIIHEFVEKFRRIPEDEDELNALVEYVLKRQNSAWSEEDENGLGDALWAIKQARTIAKDENDMGNLWYAENWLNSIKNRIQPIQPKQEWTEEDISNIQYIDSVLFYDKDLPEETCIRLRNWLQSLKPNKDMVEALRIEYEKGKADGIAEMKKHIDIMDKDNIDDFAYQCAYDLSKDWLYENASWDDVQIACKLGAKWYEEHHKVRWSEEDERHLNTTIAYLKDVKEFKKTSEDCIDWLKSLKQRHTWRPSEEQMNDLKIAIDSFTFETDYLQELYNDLKMLTND